MAAEILGPIGFCFSALGFILSTVPTAVKFAHNYQEHNEQIRGVKQRLGLCQSTFCTWEIHWVNSGLSQHGTTLRTSMDDIRRLQTEIDRAIQNATSSTTIEATAWRKMKHMLGRGLFRKVRLDRNDTYCFGDALRHALWKKEILDGWITRLERAIDVVDKSFEKDFHVRTAQHFEGKRPSLAEVKKLERLEAFAGKLVSLATDMYDEGTSTPAYAWALGLKPPETGNTILDWDMLTPVDMELRFSVGRTYEEDAHCCLQVSYEADNAESHKTNGFIGKLVQAKIMGDDANGNVVTGPCVTCYDQDASARRTFPIGSLLRTKPHLFENIGWKIERSDLIYGISVWALLLWNSPWFRSFCCHGLLIEVGALSGSSARQIFAVKEHYSCRDQDHESRLRNLGIAWAQLILGRPVRVSDSRDSLAFEQWESEDWIEISRSSLNKAILGKSTSIDLSNAIDFCLSPQSSLPTDEFRPGYLYMCMEGIYVP
jgi:hypothetical protein